MCSSLPSYPTYISDYSSTINGAQKHLNSHASNKNQHYTAFPRIITKGSCDASEFCIKQKLKHAAVKYFRILHFCVLLAVKVSHYTLVHWYFILDDFKAVSICESTKGPKCLLLVTPRGSWTPKVWQKTAFWLTVQTENLYQLLLALHLVTTILAHMQVSQLSFLELEELAKSPT